MVHKPLITARRAAEVLGALVQVGWLASRTCPNDGSVRSGYWAGAHGLRLVGGLPAQKGGPVALLTRWNPGGMRTFSMARLAAVGASHR